MSTCTYWVRARKHEMAQICIVNTWRVLLTERTKRASFIKSISCANRVERKVTEGRDLGRFCCCSPGRGGLAGGARRADSGCRLQGTWVAKGKTAANGSGALGRLSCPEDPARHGGGGGAKSWGLERWTLNLDFVLGAVVGLEGRARICTPGKVGGMSEREGEPAGLGRGGLGGRS